MKRHWILGLSLAAALATGSCEKRYEEFFFTARAAGAELCSAYTMGYVLEVEYPKGLGDTLTTVTEHLQNAVMGYRSPRQLKAGEVVYGVGYLQKGFAALNCMGIFNYTVPEMVIVSVDEDSARVMEHLLNDAKNGGGAKRDR